jgi:hypothetical protein
MVWLDFGDEGDQHGHTESMVDAWMGVLGFPWLCMIWLG